MVHPLFLCFEKARGRKARTDFSIKNSSRQKDSPDSISSSGNNFPKKLLGNKIQTLRAYASGTNLFTSTKYVGYNPEVNNQTTLSGVQGEDYGAYPLAKTFTFGLNATF